MKRSDTFRKKERAKGNSTESIRLNRELDEWVERVLEVKREIEREDQFPGAGIITYKLDLQTRSSKPLTKNFIPMFVKPLHFREWI